MTLTREEILAMEPGEELNHLVIESVLKWHKVDLKPRNNGWFWSDGHTHLGWDSFSPSTDISAAWEVVTHLMNDHKDVLVQGVSFEKNRLFDCAIYEHEDELAVTSMQSSAPEAICKAALLAVLNL
jgi:hypothetical protein